jgi:hypothetical protein
MAQNPNKPDRPNPEQRGATVMMWTAAALTLTGVTPAMVLAWTDRLHGWIMLPLVVLSYAGIALACFARRRATRGPTQSS